MTATFSSTLAKKNTARLRTQKASNILLPRFLFINFSTHTYTHTEENSFLVKGFKNVDHLSRSHYVLKLFQQLYLFSKGSEIYLIAVYLSAGPLQAKE